ncbi:MAG: T9SS type A sorting domain-containing protein [Flavobacteriales bacterium]
MKKYLLSLLSLPISICLFCQITLTRDNSYPIPGDSLTYNELVNFSPITISDENGSMWDYSELLFFSNDYPVNVITPPADIAGFESSTIAYLDQYDVIYKEVTLEKASLWGFASPQDNTIYSDPIDELRFPMSLESEFEDTFISTRYDLGGEEEGTQIGSATIQARAEGMLILPNGIEVQTLKITSESTWRNPETQQILYTLRVDTWFDGITRAYLAQSSHFEFSSGNDLDFFTYLSAEDYSYLNVKEEDVIAFDVYPNPCLDHFSINLINGSIGEYHIFSASGCLIKSGILSNKESSISTSDLTKGIYYIQVRKDSIIRTKKLVLQ